MKLEHSAHSLTGTLRCSLSGLSYTTSHITFSGATAPHPIFALESSKVIPAFLPLLSASEPNPEQLHLFGCYLTSKLPLVSWDYPLLDTDTLESWVGFWLKHLEKLASLITRIDGREFKYLAQFHIFKDAEGSSLRNLPEWIKVAHQVIDERTAPMTEEARRRNQQFRAKINENEYLSEHHCADIIRKGLQGSLLTKKEEKLFPELIASWAAKTGEFPTTKLTLPSGKRTTLSQHWINILSTAFKKNGAGLLELLNDDISVGDIEEILEHSYIHIPNDNTHAMMFFRELAELAAALKEFKFPLPSAKAIQNASTAALLDMLGASEGLSPVAKASNSGNNDPLAPKRANFSSLAEYLKAKKAYGAASTNPVTSEAELPSLPLRVEL